MTPNTYADLFWSYTAVWVILAVYIYCLGARLKKLEQLVSRHSDGEGKSHSEGKSHGERK